MGVPVGDAGRAGAAAPVVAQQSPAARKNEATAREFFAAYSRGDSAAMTAKLDPKSTYQDPSFGHLAGKDEVGHMWGLIAGGSTKVNAQVQGLQMSPDGRTATVNVVESYKFLGNPIQNHIKTTLSFGADGQITGQKDEFSWEKWGKQTGKLSPLLQTPLGHGAVRLLLRTELAAAQVGGWASTARADLSGFPADIQGKLTQAFAEIKKLMP